MKSKFQALRLNKTELKNPTNSTHIHIYVAKAKVYGFQIVPVVRRLNCKHHLSPRVESESQKTLVTMVTPVYLPDWLP